jgi:hypothetical protein
MAGVVQKMLAWAMAQRGKPYVWGATGPNSFDCSGLTQGAAAAAGIKLPRTSGEQRNAGVGVPLADIQPGDLVTFTYNDSGGNPGPGNHVALYVGAGQVVEAARTGIPVRVAPLDVKHIDRVRRIAGGGSSTAGGVVPVDDVSGAGPAGAGLQQAGYDAVIDLTPWGIPLNPLKLPGYVAGKLGGFAAGAAGSGASALADTLAPLLLATVGVVAGLALAVLGIYTAAKPHIDAQEEKLASMAPIPV